MDGRRPAAGGAAPTLQRMVTAGMVGVLCTALTACGGAAKQPVGAGKRADASPASTASSAAGSSTVTVRGLDYHPENLTVRRGTVVTWVFDDAPLIHNVAFDDGSATSPTFTHGTWTYTFTAPGTYLYHCTFHPDMVGTVTVR